LLPAFFDADRITIDQALADAITSHTREHSRLGDAMRYSTLLGGKRIRPLLLLATSRAFAVPHAHALPAACAIELLHAYSLIHDDLPAMDDDDLRRGQATCHIAFDEATAILAGDALQTLAFELTTQASDRLPAQCALNITHALAKAGGAKGMVAGQAIDLESVGKALSLNELETMHSLKTGALICAATRMGALCSENVSQHELDALDRYSHAIGLGFQVQDDILDVTSDTCTLGKQQGADQQLNKPTYPALLGLEGAQDKLRDLHQEALIALALIEKRDTSELKAIADYIVSRVF